MKERNHSLDLFKGLYIIIIMIWHICVWFYSENDKVINISTPDHIKWFIAEGISKLSFGAVSLPFIAGISACYSLGKSELNYFIKRGFFLLIIGYSLNFLTFGWGYFSDTFSWDALHFVGLCLILFPFFNSLKNRTLYLVILISPLIPTLFNHQENYLYKIILGDINGNNYYPFFPWISAFLSGIIWFRLKGNPHKILLIITIGLIITILFGSFFTVDLQDVWGPNMFMPNYTHFFGGLFRGIMLLQLITLSNIKINWLGNVGKNILMLYIAHSILVVNYIKLFNPSSFYSCYIFLFFLIILTQKKDLIILNRRN